MYCKHIEFSSAAIDERCKTLTEGAEPAEMAGRRVEEHHEGQLRILKDSPGAQLQQSTTEQNSQAQRLKEANIELEGVKVSFFLGSCVLFTVLIQLSIGACEGTRAASPDTQRTKRVICASQQPERRVPGASGSS